MSYINTKNQMLKFIKPVTSSKRRLVKLLNLQLTLKKKPLLKGKIKSLKNFAGNNNFGKITIRSKGGGHKKKYRQVNFFRSNNSVGIICSIEYDPYRKANIASVFEIFSNCFFYILAPQKLKIGDIIKSGRNAEIKIGHSLPLWKMPTGSCVHNISIKNKSYGQVSRSAGAYSQIVETTAKHVKMQMSSRKYKLFSLNCYGTIGIISNEFFFLNKIAKAGRSRWLNKRPKVRGTAMNSVDHPNGGGEGKKSGRGLNYWGKPTKKGKQKKND